MASTGGIGARGEELATRHLRGLGWAIIDRNWRPSGQGLRGELDIVALDGDTVVFVEVKTRRGCGTGGPLVAVTARKHQQLRRLAGAWLAQADAYVASVRFDVIGIQLRPASPVTQIDHVRGITP